MDAIGAPVTDPGTLARIRSLAIPPAWQEVWICPWPNGHIQAVGIDAAGRRQYRYHDAWIERRDREKFERALRLGAILPELRERLAKDLTGRGLTQSRVLACAIRLVDLGLFRIGGEEYARDNDSYGIATVLRSHVTVRRGGVDFAFPAKSNIEGSERVTDPAVCAVVRALVRRSDPSPELLAWWSPSERRWRDVRSQHINEHIRNLTGEDLTAKDFRTWHATVLMALALCDVSRNGSARARKRALNQCYRDVAEALGNTVAVARKSYVDPRVIDLFHDGMTISQPSLNGRVDLVPTVASSAVVDMLCS